MLRQSLRRPRLDFVRPEFYSSVVEIVTKHGYIARSFFTPTPITDTQPVRRFLHASLLLRLLLLFEIRRAAPRPNSHWLFRRIFQSSKQRRDRTKNMRPRYRRTINVVSINFQFRNISEITSARSNVTRQSSAEKRSHH